MIILQNGKAAFRYFFIYDEKENRVRFITKVNAEEMKDDFGCIVVNENGVKIEYKSNGIYMYLECNYFYRMPYGNGWECLARELASALEVEFMSNGAQSDWDCLHGESRWVESDGDLMNRKEFL